MNTDTKNKLNEYNNRLIYKKFSQLACISIHNVYDYSELSEEKKDLINKISCVDCSKSFTSKLLDTPYKYIEYMYQTLNIERKLYRWLIPMFGTSKNCYELSINDIFLFSKSYFQEDVFNDFLAFDLDDDFLFDICIGEKGIDYFIINYNDRNNRKP